MTALASEQAPADAGASDVGERKQPFVKKRDKLSSGGAGEAGTLMRVPVQCVDAGCCCWLSVPEVALRKGRRMSRMTAGVEGTRNCPGRRPVGERTHVQAGIGWYASV